MDSFHFRTEDIDPDQILPLFVETNDDRRAVNLLKSASPIVIEGSRGVGKSFLLRVAEAELKRDFDTEPVLPVYVSFVRTSLVHSPDPQQFRHWMLARLASRILRALRQRGLVPSITPAIASIAGVADVSISDPGLHMDQLAKCYEESYKNPEQQIDSSGIPDVEDLKDAIEDVCGSLGLSRIVLLFDEAAHIFRPAAQRTFFTIFRDLRSPWIGCNAAVYPGVTAYGDTFQPAHDATFVRLDRDVQDGAYVSNMRDMVERQADAGLQATIAKNGQNFATLAYAVSGNPRLLLKTIAKAPRLNSSEVNSVLKEFYRTEIWSEHSGLAANYPGHRSLIDWGRRFIEDTVLPETKGKNDQWHREGKAESTCYFWIHRDAPHVVSEALRLLAYTGIVSVDATGIRATRADLGTRYSVNLGCLFALEPAPASTAFEIAKQLTKRRFTEFGANHASYTDLTKEVGDFQETDLLDVLRTQLGRGVDVLDITDFQREKLAELELGTVGGVLQSSEADLQRAYYIGPIRARQMMNSASASVLEYLSG